MLLLWFSCVTLHGPHAATNIDWNVLVQAQARIARMHSHRLPSDTNHDADVPELVENFEQAAQ